VKNVGVAAVESIIEVRQTGEKFASFFDFCDRVDLRRINKKVLESLIKCGAFDAMEKNRCRLMEGHERVVDIAQKRSRDRASGQFSLFDSADMDRLPEVELPDVSEWDKDTILSYEKETLGFYITGHPLLRFGSKLNLVADCDSETVLRKVDGSNVSLAGIVTNVREITTKRNDTITSDS